MSGFLVVKMEKMSILFLRWAVLMKNVSFYYMHLLYKMDDIDTKSKRLFSIFNIQYSIKMSSINVSFCL